MLEGLEECDCHRKKGGSSISPIKTTFSEGDGGKKHPTKKFWGGIHQIGKRMPRRKEFLARGSGGGTTLGSGKKCEIELEKGKNG